MKVTKPIPHVHTGRLEAAAERWGVNLESYRRRLIGDLVAPWTCRCGREHLWLLDKHGRPYASCRVCGAAVFVADVAHFIVHGPCGHAPAAQRCARTKMNPRTKRPEKRRVALYTSRCRECAVRRFWRGGAR